MRDRVQQIIAECRHIATLSEEHGKTTRRFLTPPVREVHAHLRGLMEATRMAVHVDAAGNLRGTWEPPGAQSPRLILGSHIDTVPNAGAFDGVLGVIMAIEWVRLAQEMACPFAIEVIAFSEEEGVRFGLPFLGSRAVAGRFDSAILQLKDAKGISLEQAIRDFGLDPGMLESAAVHDPMLGFIEIHIEQGPILEAEDGSLAVVSSIAGQTRLSLQFDGQANHAGTTPMHLRRDALAAAAEWISFVEQFATKTEGLVATAGKIIVEPNAVNVIAGSATLSLDVRHARDSARIEAVERILEQAKTIAQRRKLTLSHSRQTNEPAVPMDERLSAYLAESLQAAGLTPRALTSGAGHDAMVMAARMPAAMLFLRSPGGISHHPAESVREEDVEAALRVGRTFLKRLGGEIRSSLNRQG